MRRSAVRVRPPAPEKSMSLIFSVSGLRGTLGDGLTPPVILDYIIAYHRVFQPRRVLTGRDPRPHGPWIQQLVNAVFNALGTEVMDAGMVPTPTLLFHVRHGSFDGGIVVTASHNPLEWNALKFVGPKGIFLAPDEIQAMKEALDVRTIPWAPYDQTEQTRSYPRAVEQHVEAILNTFQEALAPLKEQQVRVAVDCVNGAMSYALPLLLERVGVQVLRLHCNGNGRFPHPPEPKPEHLSELDGLLRQGTADLGFATDPDGDRLVFGLKGRGVLSEEYTLPVAMYAVLQQERGPVATNFSTSMMNEWVAQKFGVPLIRTPVGEIHVTQALLEQGGIIGGEGNGGVIYPKLNATRDGLLAAALILTVFAGGELEALLDQLPQYTRIKDRIEGVRTFDPDPLTDRFPDAEVHREDGVYLRWPEQWLHVRPSNTEPILRIYAEGRDPDALRTLVDQVKALYA